MHVGFGLLAKPLAKPGVRKRCAAWVDPCEDCDGNYLLSPEQMKRPPSDEAFSLSFTFFGAAFWFREEIWGFWRFVVRAVWEVSCPCSQVSREPLCVGLSTGRTAWGKNGGKEQYPFALWEAQVAWRTRW